MGKIALLAPNKELLDIAEKITEEEHIEIGIMRLIRITDAVNEARAAIEAGAQIIIARGYQAKLIKEYTNVPLIEIRFHAQEIGLLLKKARTLVKKECPHIMLVVFDNMLCDMTHMEELFGVRLTIACLDRMEDSIGKLQEMADDRPDLVIGGEIVCQEAERMGYPAFLYRSTEESVREALHQAVLMSEALEIDKQNTAQLETILDTSFSGIVKINVEGEIIFANRSAERLTGKSAEELLGLSASSVFPEISEAAVENVLCGKRENYTISVNIRNQSWMLQIAPIRYENEITGAILSFQRVSGSIRPDRGSMFLHGFTTRTTFRHLRTENEQMGTVLETAKEYALSDSPILICSGEGTEYYQVAEAIHNNSARRSGPFVSLNVRGMRGERQMQILFGDPDAEESGSTVSRGKGILEKANYGTFFLKEIEYLEPEAQNRICRLLLPGASARTDAQPAENLDVRLIAFTKGNLQSYVQDGKFSEELFYHLQGLTLEIPGLDRRPEDLVSCFNRYLREYSAKYNKRIAVTEGGYRKLAELAWPGSQIQLRAFCERLVLTQSRRSVDETRIQKLYGELYPMIVRREGESHVVVYKSPEAVKISSALAKFHGNRNLAAGELGISTSTLWRKMKKYGIEADYK